MSATLLLEEPPAAEHEKDTGLRGGDEVAAGRVPFEARRVVYGRDDCPFGWVCLADHHEHELSPIALIDVYGLPDDDS